ncbi:MAG: tetratricopeptide repeat protein [Bacteroidota bacterium]
MDTPTLSDLIARGVALLEDKDYAAALVVFEQAAEVNPDYASAYNNRGIVLDRLGRYGEALEAFDRVLDIDPDIAVAHFNRALTVDKIDAEDPGASIGDRSPAWEASRSRLAALAILERKGLRTAQDTGTYSHLLQHWMKRQTRPLLAHRLITEQPFVAEVPPEETEPDAETRPSEEAIGLSSSGMAWGDIRATSRPYRELARYHATRQSHLPEADWLRLLGLGAFYLGDPFTAREHFDALDTLDETDPLGQYYLACCYTEVGDDDMAASVLEVALPHARATLAGTGSSPETLYYAGLLFVLGENPEHALPTLEAFQQSAEAGTLGHRFLPALCMRVLVLDMLERWDEKQDALRAVPEEEAGLRAAGRTGFLGGIHLGQVDDVEGGAAHRFHRYAHAMESLGALDLVLLHLRDYQAKNGRLPPELPAKDWRTVEFDLTPGAAPLGPRRRGNSPISSSRRFRTPWTNRPSARSSTFGSSYREHRPISSRSQTPPAWSDPWRSGSRTPRRETRPRHSSRPSAITRSPSTF